MAHSTFSIRMDDTVKEKFDEFCSTVGMNATTAFNMFARAVIREQRLPFEVTTDPFYHAVNQRHINNAIERIEAGQYSVHELLENEDD